MSFEIYISNSFRKQARRLIRKYPSLKSELHDLEGLLSKKHDYGTPLGKGCFKIRLGVRSKGRGKSGGVRVITWLLIRIDKLSNKSTLINLISIFDKSEFETISDKDLGELIKQIQSELKI